MTIIVSGSLRVDPAERDAYLEARVPILEHARDAPGCLDFSLSADLLDAGRVNVYERHGPGHAAARSDRTARRAQPAVRGGEQRRLGRPVACSSRGPLG
jgi:quinol monooxygenase YgiN